MKKHLIYLKKNIENDARIVIPYIGEGCIIHPSYVSIRRKTAILLVNELGMITIPAYLDHKNHDAGASMAIFKENRNKY